MSKNNTRKSKRKLPMLVQLVIMVFCILLVSMIVSACIIYYLSYLNILPSVAQNGPIPLFLFVLLDSLIIGTVLTRISWKRFLSQFHNIAEVTKEVAGGNFNVRMKPAQTKEVNLIAG